MILAMTEAKVGCTIYRNIQSTLLRRQVSLLSQRRLGSVIVQGGANQVALIADFVVKHGKPCSELHGSEANEKRNCKSDVAKLSDGSLKHKIASD